MASIAAKLAASEREADAARVRAKLKAARMGRSAPRPQAAESPVEPPPSAEALPNSSDPVKRDLTAALPKPTAHGPPDFSEAELDELAPTKLEVAKGRKVKREQRRTSRTVSRRRSTLSPWELESLIQGNMEGVASEAQ